MLIAYPSTSTGQAADLDGPSFRVRGADSLPNTLLLREILQFGAIPAAVVRENARDPPSAPRPSRPPPLRSVNVNRPISPSTRYVLSCARSLSPDFRRSACWWSFFPPPSDTVTMPRAAPETIHLAPPDPAPSCLARQIRVIPD
jgi:hypothetical protein